VISSKTDWIQDEGVAVGSALWMSPEVLQGLKLTEKIDIYSFGLIFWEIIMRVQPYGEYKTVSELRRAVCKEDVRPTLKGIPPCLSDLVELCWEKDPMKRPSFVQVLEILKDAMVDLFLSPVCHDIANLWKVERRWRGKEQVKFTSLTRALCNYLRIRHKDHILPFKCLQALASVEKKKDQTRLPWYQWID